MATNPSTGGATALPFALLAQAIPMLSRHDLEALAERLIDHLDTNDGDPDLEPNGDEEDGQFSEDEPAAKFTIMDKGPGCDLSDGGEDADSDYCLSGEDRGSGHMPNALFNGYSAHHAIESDPDCERWRQSVTLN